MRKIIALSSLLVLGALGFGCAPEPTANNAQRANANAVVNSVQTAANQVQNAANALANQAVNAVNSAVANANANANANKSNTANK